MNYEKKECGQDTMLGLIRVFGICFEKEASDTFIDEVVSDVLSMDTLVHGLMTAKAICRYNEFFEEYFLERLAVMPIGSSVNFDEIKVTRWSKNTYICVKK